VNHRCDRQKDVTDIGTDRQAELR